MPIAPEVVLAWRQAFLELVRAALSCSHYCEQNTRTSIPENLLIRLTQAAVQLRKVEESIDTVTLESLLPKGIWELRLYRAAQSWTVPTQDAQDANCLSDSRKIAALKAVVQSRIT